MLTNQDRPQQRCKCGRGYVYTDNCPGTPNGQCTQCSLEEIMTAAFAAKDSMNANLNRRAD